MIVSDMKVAKQRQGESKRGLSVGDLKDIMPGGYLGAPLEVMLPDGLIYPVTAMFTTKRPGEKMPRLVFSAGDVKIDGVPYVYDKETNEKRTDYTLVSEKDRQEMPKDPEEVTLVIAVDSKDAEDWLANNKHLATLKAPYTVEVISTSRGLKELLNNPSKVFRNAYWTGRAYGLLETLLSQCIVIRDIIVEVSENNNQRIDQVRVNDYGHEVLLKNPIKEKR